MLPVVAIVTYCITFVKLFDGCKPGKFPIPPILRDKMQHNLVRGEHFTGRWADVGTPERLKSANASDPALGAI